METTQKGLAQDYGDGNELKEFNLARNGAIMLWIYNFYLLQRSKMNFYEDDEMTKFFPSYQEESEKIDHETN